MEGKWGGSAAALASQRKQDERREFGMRDDLGCWRV